MRRRRTRLAPGKTTSTPYHILMNPSHKRGSNSSLRHDKESSSEETESELEHDAYDTSEDEGKNQENSAFNLSSESEKAPISNLRQSTPCRNESDSMSGRSLVSRDQQQAKIEEVETDHSSKSKKSSSDHQIIDLLEDSDDDDANQSHKPIHNLNFTCGEEKKDAKEHSHKDKTLIKSEEGPPVTFKSITDKIIKLLDEDANVINQDSNLAPMQGHQWRQSADEEKKLETKAKQPNNTENTNSPGKAGKPYKSKQIKYGAPLDYLEERFQKENSSNSSNETENTKNRESWCGATDLEIAMVQCCNDDAHGSLRSGKEPYFLAILYHCCQSIQDRALALSILHRTNLHDPLTMSTFLSIGGLNILSDWFFDAINPIQKEKLVIQKKNSEQQNQCKEKKRKNSRSSRSPVANIEEYETQIEHVPSPTGPLLLALLSVLEGIPLRQTHFLNSTSIITRISSLQTILDQKIQIATTNGTSLATLTDASSGGLPVVKVTKALQNLMDIWKTNTENAESIPLKSKQEYFSSLINTIQKGYDALCAYEKQKIDKSDRLILDDEKSRNGNTNQLNNTSSSDSYTNATLQKKQIQQKLQMSKSAASQRRNLHNRTLARKRMLENKAEKERLRSEAEAKKQKLHAKFHQAKGPKQAARESQLKAYHNLEMDVSLKRYKQGIVTAEDLNEQEKRKSISWADDGTNTASLVDVRVMKEEECEFDEELFPTSS